MKLCKAQNTRCVVGYERATVQGRLRSTDFCPISNFDFYHTIHCAIVCLCACISISIRFYLVIKLFGYPVTIL